MNEEDIRGKLLLPYLQDLGIDISEIFLEHSFTVRLGKKNHATGRADILCKRNNRNLFVIELKNDSIEINQDVIDQGISYARLLLDDIAPFTIISNGRTTKIFDSITKKELSGNIENQSSFFANGYNLSADENIRLRYEGLKHFISLSSDNLKIFCESQLYERMGPIIGNIDSPYSKFVKELYVHRDELQLAFASFLNSTESIFGLVGNAGVGKTNTICSLALQNLENSFVLFYNAAIIKSPLECVAQDLNITFSSRSEPDVVLKKLNEIGRSANKTVLIFIDALDESTNSGIAVELSEIALIAKNLEKVKIVVSCKSNIWNSILKINNTPTHLHEVLKKSHSTISDLDNCPGYQLKDFTDKELEEIIPLYQKTFKFKGEISDTLFKELRNGFFLKIFSEVYSNKNIPDKISDKELIQKYLKQSLNETTLGYLRGSRTLAEIGKIIFNYKYDSWAAFKDEGIDVKYIHDKLNLSFDETISEDLFTKNILIKSNNGNSYNISFYYSKIRDYVICFQSYILDKLSNDNFYKVLPDFYQNHISKSALDFYIENASSNHLYTLSEFKKDQALKYVKGYDKYLNKNFKKFKEKFEPETKGKIGIYLPKDIIRDDGYSLFRLPNDSNYRIAFENFKDFDNSGWDLWFEKGIKSLHGSNFSLMAKDQKTVIKKNIFKQLKEILEKGKVNTYLSDILLLESLSVILYFYHKKLDFEITVNDYYLPRFNNIYPIDLTSLKLKIDKFKLREHFKYHPVGQMQIDEMVEKAIVEKHDIPEYNWTGDAPPIRELGKIVDLLLERGYSEITDHYLPLPDISIEEAKSFYEQNRKDNWHIIRSAQYTETQTQLYIKDFFKHLEKCYKIFVEDCFPTFKDKFHFYSTMPHDYLFYMKESNVHKWGVYGYRKSKTGNLDIIFKDLKYEDEAFKIEGIKSLRGFSLDSILRINDYHKYPVKTVDKHNTSDVDEHCVIRNWIYKLLERDMAKLFKKYDD